MALNIKDPETERLAAELADQLQTSKTGAIRHALRAQLTIQEGRQAERFTAAMEVLRTEIWPLTQGMAPLTKRDREDILGYDEHGLPA